MSNEEFKQKIEQIELFTEEELKNFDMVLPDTSFDTLQSNVLPKDLEDNFQQDNAKQLELDLESEIDQEKELNFEHSDFHDRMIMEDSGLIEDTFTESYFYPDICDELNEPTNF